MIHKNAFNAWVCADAQAAMAKERVRQGLILRVNKKICQMMLLQTRFDA